MGLHEKPGQRNSPSEDQLGQSYVVPDGEIHFPFLDVEFKAQGGSHIVATNQAANAGAVVSNGILELARCSLALDSLDYNEPHFFSLSMDHTSVYVYGHWLAVGSGQFSFHVERLALHDLRSLDGLRAVHRTVKIIFDWSRNERL